MICNLTGLNQGFFLLLRRRSVGVTIRSAMLMLSVTLLAASPLPVSAATPDPVLEWIGVMNTAVFAGGSSPLARQSGRPSFVRRARYPCLRRMPTASTEKTQYGPRQ